MVAKEIGAAVVMIERELSNPFTTVLSHECRAYWCQDRNWGASLPYAYQDTKNLQQHTLQNAVTDLVRFAREIQLPFDSNSSSNAPQAVSKDCISFILTIES
jgi:hypothetical protein